MARALRIQFEDAIYHLCARGNRRESIYRSEKDYLWFEHLLAESLTRYSVELHAFVLLPNHFHLLARTLQPNLSRWMHWLITSYSVWFNRRHRTSGHLFQGRYKAFLVQDGEYLLELSRYLHLNPVRGRAIGAGDPSKRRERLRRFVWSSYRGYAGLSTQEQFVTEDLVLGEVGDGINVHRCKVQYRHFVEEGLLREIENPFEQVRWQSVLGDESFVRRLKDKFKSRHDHREVTGIHKLRMLNADEVIKRVANHYGTSPHALLQKRVHASEAHNVTLWLLRKKSGLTLREIGLLFGGMDYAAVGQRIRRMQQSISRTKQLRKTCQLLDV